MAPIATLTVRVSAQIAELQKSFTDASKSTKDFQDNFESVATRAAAAGTVIGETFTKLASGIARAFGASVTSVIALGGALTDLSAKTGISVRALQEFQFAGERVGVSLDDVSTAVLQMQKQLEGGGKPVAAALQTIGLSLKDLQGLKPEEQFRKIAASLAQIQDPALRNKTAFDIMGKAAASVLPLIGSDMDAAAAKAHALGVVLDDETVAALDDLGDTFGDLKIASQALFAKGLAPLLPLVTSVARAVAEMPAPLQAVAAGVAALAAVAAPLGLALSAVTSGFTAVVGGVSSVVGGLRSVTSSFIDGTKAIYDYITASKSADLAKVGEGAPAAAKNVYGVATALGVLLVALHEVQDYVAMKAEGRHVSWWETLIPPVGEWESMKSSFKQGVEGLQPIFGSFNAYVAGQYGGITSGANAAGAAIGATAGPTKAAAAAMSELARLNKQYQDDLSSKGLQAFKDAATLHDKYATSIADAAKEQGIAESSLQRYIDDQRAAEAGVRKHTEELTRLTEADKKWRDQVTGRAAAQALADLTRRWDSLTAAEQKNPAVIKAAVAEYDKLRDTLPKVGGEMESLRNTTQDTIPTTQTLQQHMLLFGTATLDASLMVEQGANALQGFQRNGNLVSASLADMAVQMKAVPWATPGKNLEAIYRAARPIHDTFRALGEELPHLLTDALVRGESIWGTLANAAAGQFMTTFQKAVERSKRPGGAPVTGTETALGAIGAGIDIFTGGYAIGASQGKAKGALGGAASGALSGAAMGSVVPGIGTLVGGVVGGAIGLFGGLFGGSKKDKADKQALAENKQALLDQYGGMKQLVALADQLHVNIKQAFDAKNADQFTAAVNQLNKAIDEEKKKMEALGGAVDALNTRTGVFAAKFQAILDAKPPEGASASDTDAFQTQQAGKLAALAQTSGDEFDRLGMIARDTFAGLVKDNGNAIAAMEQMGPTFQVLEDGVDKFGLTASGVTQDLIDNFRLVNDAAFKPLFDQIVSDGQILQDLMSAKSLSPEGFQALATDIGAGIQGVIDKGGDMQRTLALSQPVLQSLWEAQQQYGAITDDTTAKILEQAHSQGLVGDQMKGVNEQILDVLLSIGKVLGADLPDYFNKLQTPAQNAADDVQQAFSQIDIPPIDIKYQYVAMNDAPAGVSIPKLGTGGIVRSPTLALVGESGPEAVIPLSSGGLGVMPQNYQTDIYLDGDRIARSTAKRMPGVLKGVGVGV